MSASEQARADAMADAETLRMNDPRRQQKTCLCIESIPSNETQDAYHARLHASAAFRAIPGLRGDR